jgi:hypothetical protein
LLDPHELHRTGAAAVLNAKLNYLANPLHECVQILCLGMATGKGRNGGDIVAVFIPLNDDGEFSRLSHRADSSTVE